MVSAHLGGTVHVHARNRQRGDVHGHTAVQVQRADEEEEPSARYGPVDRKTLLTIEWQTWS